MFACIYGRSVAKSGVGDSPVTENKASVLIDLAFEFSPLIEQTSVDTVVLDIAGQGILYGPVATETTNGEIEAARNLAHEIARRAKLRNLKISVVVAANCDVAIHAARAFQGVTIIENDSVELQGLSIKTIDCSLVGIEAKRAEEIHETFAWWGIRTFGDLARLPQSGVSERLGQEGVRLQKLAQGKTDRSLILVRPPIGFAQSLELEHPVSELEPLSFILSRLLNQLCANLHEYAVATNELKLDLKLEGGQQHQRSISLPVPMRTPKTLLRLILFDIEAQPPPGPVIAVAIMAEPVKPRASQSGLFIPLAPEPEKLEITLARLAKLVGADNVGSPEMLDTHRPDSFRMNKFRVLERKNARFALRRERRPASQTAVQTALPGIGFRIFRPAWRADVQTRQGKPVRISARSEQSEGKVSGTVVCAAGPWRASGDWWRQDVWARDEWDVALIDPAAPESEVLCRVYRDLATEQWFVAGIYD